MPKDQIVVLVSRAIAIIQGVIAILEISYLPERLMWFYHYRSPAGALAGSFLDRYHSTEIGMLCFRIAALLVFTYIFWQCGPKFRAFLSPAGGNNPQPDEASVQS